MAHHAVNESHIKVLIDSYVHTGLYPGLIVGVFDDTGKEVLVHSARCSDSEQLYDKQSTMFRVHSITKPLTTISLMILEERGLLSLSDNISKYLPELTNMTVLVKGSVGDYETTPAVTPLTFTHLLTHTSGTTYGFGRRPIDKIFLHKLGDLNHWSEFGHRSAAEFLQAVASSPLLFQPGTGWEYGINYELLGIVIERASGRPYKDFVQTEIFDRIGMKDSTFSVPDHLHNCVPPATDFVAGYRTCPSVEPWLHQTEYGPVFHSGLGMFTTLSDYSRLVTLLLNKGALDGVRLISETNALRMTANQLPNGADVADLTAVRGILEVDTGGFGFGFSIYSIIDPQNVPGGSLSSVGEFGFNGIASCWFYADREHKHSVILFSAIQPTNIYPIRAQLRYLVHRMMQDRASSQQQRASSVQK